MTRLHHVSAWFTRVPGIATAPGVPTASGGELQGNGGRESQAGLEGTGAMAWDPVPPGVLCQAPWAASGEGPMRPTSLPSGS